MLNQVATEKLNNLNTLLLGLGKKSHHHPADYGKAVQVFVDLCQTDECAHPDAVRKWAKDNGWSEQDARDLGEMADTVDHTLRIVGSI